MTGLALGGNKTRKLEYLLFDALEKKSDVIITVGCPQSNHARQTAAACRLYSLECYLFLVDDKTGEINNEKYEGNMLLDEILGAKIILCDNDIEARSKIESLISELKQKGNNPYYIPAGGSNGVGFLGYINAMKEILEDEKKINVNFDYIVFASSSYGTQCGLILGNKLFNIAEQEKKIVGISICKLFLDSSSELNDTQKMVKMMTDFSEENGLNLNIKEEDIIYDQRFNAAGYAVLCGNDKRAIDLFALNEAIILDPVYSGRAAGGLIKMIENNEFENNSNVLFIHTGGAPALFTGLYKKNVE